MQGFVLVCVTVVPFVLFLCADPVAPADVGRASGSIACHSAVDSSACFCAPLGRLQAVLRGNNSGVASKDLLMYLYKAEVPVDLGSLHSFTVERFAANSQPWPPTLQRSPSHRGSASCSPEPTRIPMDGLQLSAHMTSTRCKICSKPTSRIWSRSSKRMERAGPKESEMLCEAFSRIPPF